eukprot:3108765-Alexandrium_andersonii.AAC.1
MCIRDSALRVSLSIWTGRTCGWPCASWRRTTGRSLVDGVGLLCHWVLSSRRASVWSSRRASQLVGSVRSVRGLLLVAGMAAGAP